MFSSSHILSYLQNFILPPSCLCCATLVEDYGCLCASCWRRIDFIAAAPLREMAQSRYDEARAVMRYDSAPVRALVARIKYADRPEIAAWLGGWLARAGADILNTADVLAPVPLHRRRLMRRRFNQAAELARALKRITQTPLIPDLMERTRHTPSQVGLTRAQRRRNVAGAFALNPQHASAVKSRHVILVDDILTSGATMNACAHVLKAAVQSVSRSSFSRASLMGRSQPSFSASAI